jgi:hypothetical protein
MRRLKPIKTLVLYDVRYYRQYEKFNIEKLNDFQQESIDNSLLQRDVFLSD